MDGPKRGFWLTAFLILWCATNSGLAIYYLIAAVTTAPAQLGNYWMFIRGASNVLFLTAVWRWKKWGVYGLFGMLGVGIIVTMAMGTTFPVFIGLILGAAILVGLFYFLLRKHWHHMS